MTITAVAAVWPSSEDGPGAGVVGGVGGATWTGATWTGATWGGLLSGTAAAVSHSSSSLSSLTTTGGRGLPLALEDPPGVTHYPPFWLQGQHPCPHRAQTTRLSSMPCSGRQSESSFL